MSTEIFLGGLALLILAATIIVALTTGDRSYDNRNPSARNSKSDRQGD